MSVFLYVWQTIRLQNQPFLTEMRTYLIRAPPCSAPGRLPCVLLGASRDDNMWLLSHH